MSPAPAAPSPDADSPARAAFADTIRRRNRRETAAAVVVAAWAVGRVVLDATRGDPPGAATLMGLGLLTAAVLLIVGVLHTRGRPAPQAPVARQAATQADLLVWAWLWYALPLAVGGTAYVGGLLADRGQSLSATVLAIVWGMCGLVALLNLWAAGRLRALARAS